MKKENEMKKKGEKNKKKKKIKEKRGFVRVGMKVEIDR